MRSSLYRHWCPWWNTGCTTPHHTKKQESTWRPDSMALEQPLPTYCNNLTAQDGALQKWRSSSQPASEFQTRVGKSTPQGNMVLLLRSRKHSGLKDWIDFNQQAQDSWSVPRLLKRAKPNPGQIYLFLPVILLQQATTTTLKARRKFSTIEMWSKPVMCTEFYLEPWPARPRKYWFSLSYFHFFRYVLGDAWACWPVNF